MANSMHENDLRNNQYSSPGYAAKCQKRVPGISWPFSGHCPPINAALQYLCIFVPASSLLPNRKERSKLPTPIAGH